MTEHARATGHTVEYRAGWVGWKCLTCPARARGWELLVRPDDVCVHGYRVGQCPVLSCDPGL